MKFLVELSESYNNIIDEELNNKGYNVIYTSNTAELIGVEKENGNISEIEKINGISKAIKVENDKWNKHLIPKLKVKDGIVQINTPIEKRWFSEFIK